MHYCALIKVKVDPEGAEPKKKARVAEAQAKRDEQRKPVTRKQQGKPVTRRSIEKQLHCEACNASFKSIQDLKRHEKKQQGKKLIHKPQSAITVKLVTRLLKASKP